MPGQRNPRRGDSTWKEKYRSRGKLSTSVSVHNLRQFLGLASYFPKYVKDFSLTEKPLTTLTKRDVKFTWDQEQQEAFGSLKKLGFATYSGTIRSILDD